MTHASAKRWLHAWCNAWSAAISGISWTGAMQQVRLAHQLVWHTGRPTITTKTFQMIFCTSKRSCKMLHMWLSIARTCIDACTDLPLRLCLVTPLYRDDLLGLGCTEALDGPCNSRWQAVSTDPAELDTYMLWTLSAAFLVNVDHSCKIQEPYCCIPACCQVDILQLPGYSYTSECLQLEQTQMY